MSARDPLTVLTADGVSWWRRGWDFEDHGLYAHGEDTGAFPRLWTIRQLSEQFGLRGMSAPEPEPDGITRRIAPTQALQEVPPLRGRVRLDASAADAAESTHWARLGHDMPDRRCSDAAPHGAHVAEAGLSSEWLCHGVPHPAELGGAL